ncbi:shikimate kinase [Phaeovulum sp. NW3]|uniref:shikimate kinase n=1 Tax=Phaeovulum sp. NW3 TaxID=2934933 RepID=UPI0032E47766
MKITIAQAPAHQRGTAQGKAGGGRVAQSGSQAGSGPRGPDFAQDGGLRLTRPVVLVGMMGSGKTAVGTALARLLGVPFLDSDEEIERAAQMSVSEIFARDGEPFFRDRESEVLARLLAGVPAVVSTGGGAFMAERNRAAIAERGVSVWLKADLDLLWNRVRHKNTRPLLRTSDPKGTLARLLADREPVYALAQVVVEAQPGLSIEDMAHKVIAALRAQPGAFATKGE